MAWVKERYAGEMAVLLTWLLALLPWSVTWFDEQGISVVAFRFLPLRIQYVFGVDLPNAEPFIPAWEVADFQASPELTFAGHLSTVIFLVGGVVVLASVAYYLAEDAFEARSPMHPVRLFGWLHAAFGLVMLAGTAVFFRYHVGVTIPVGALFAPIFAYLLLSAELESDESDAETGAAVAETS